MVIAIQEEDVACIEMQSNLWSKQVSEGTKKVMRKSNKGKRVCKGKARGSKSSKSSRSSCGASKKVIRPGLGRWDMPKYDYKLGADVKKE